VTAARDPWTDELDSPGAQGGAGRGSFTAGGTTSDADQTFRRFVRTVDERGGAKDGWEGDQIGAGRLGTEGGSEPQGCRLDRAPPGRGAGDLVTTARGRSNTRSARRAPVRLPRPAGFRGGRGVVRGAAAGAAAASLCAFAAELPRGLRVPPRPVRDRSGRGARTSGQTERRDDRHDQAAVDLAASGVVQDASHSGPTIGNPGKLVGPPGGLIATYPMSLDTAVKGVAESLPRNPVYSGKPGFTLQGRPLGRMPASLRPRERGLRIKARSPARLRTSHRTERSPSWPESATLSL
jgi:hypothetical protein